MFCMEHVKGTIPSTRVRDVSISIEKPVVQAVICPNISTIDEIINILHTPNTVSHGEIRMDGKGYYTQDLYEKVAFVTRRSHLYDNLSVADNIIFQTDKVPFFVSDRKIHQRCEKLLEEIEYSVDVKCKVKYLSYEQKVLVSIVRAMAMSPRLLVVDEIHGQLSYKGMSCFLRILEKLKKQGTMVLYFTSQWEDAVKMGDAITVISHGKTYSEYTVDEIRKSPDKIYHVMLGGEKLNTQEQGFDEQKAEFLRTLSQGVGELRTGYDQNNMLKDLAKMIAEELQGAYCVIYLIDEKNNGLMEISNVPEKELPKIRREKLKELNQSGEFYYTSIYEKAEFESYFAENDMRNVEAVFGCPIKSSGQNAGLVQVYYDEYYVYSEKDSLYLGLISREIAMVIENSRLMGRSVLLQESHHRIKNNLQIIISLLQMEKMMLEHKLVYEESVCEVKEMIDAIIGRVKSIATIHNILAHDGSINNVADISDIIEEIRKFYDYSADISVDTDKVFVPYNKATSLALVINELINNSVKHAALKEERLKIQISIKREVEKESFVLVYRDSGTGFPEDFDAEMQTGVGIMVIKSIVQQEFRGSVKFMNMDGAYVLIRIPQKTFL